MIPRTINYIFGFDENFCKKPFAYFHYLNVLSTRIKNPDYKINFYYHFKPENDEYFEKLKDICNLIKVPVVYDNIGTKKVIHREHIGDFFRINLLFREGGIYLDIDTICLKSLDEFTLSDTCIMGIEQCNNLIGLCNAVIMSPKQSEFIKLWIDDYFENFLVEDWGYNSVKFPYSLSKKFPNLISIQPKESFFKYTWDENGINSLLNTNSPIDDCYLIHLWESFTYKTLSTYTKFNLPDNTIGNIYKTYA